MKVHGGRWRWKVKGVGVGDEGAWDGGRGNTGEGGLHPSEASAPTATSRKCYTR